jgi:hypothetical protein
LSPVGFTIATEPVDEVVLQEIGVSHDAIVEWKQR